MKNTAVFHTLFLSVVFLCAPPLRSQNPSNPENPRVTESEERLGVFAVGGRAFTVMTRIQTISPASRARFSSTVAQLDIRDADANTVYQETFSAPLADGRFARTLAVSASLLTGTGGQALVLRFLEEPASTGSGESWQMFGLVNGQLTAYGAPLPLGQGGAVNGVLAGVMLRGGIGVVPLATTAEALEFRVWTGHFFLNVPVRIDWNQGLWSEAEQCFANENGSLQPAGCNLSVALVRQSVAEGAFVTVYTQPQENAYDSQQIPVHPNSVVEFPAARALVKWQKSGDRFTCTFGDVWLRVRIDQQEGWVHSAADFTALGLPSSAAP